MIFQPFKITFKQFQFFIHKCWPGVGREKDKVQRTA